MQPVKFTCPHCQSVLRSPKPLPNGVQITCVTCHQPFTVQVAQQQQSTQASYDGGTELPAEALDEDLSDLGGPGDMVSVRQRRRKSGAGGLVVAGVIVFLLLAGGVGTVLFFLLREQSASADKGRNTPETTQTVASTNATPVASVPEKKTEHILPVKNDPKGRPRTQPEQKDKRNAPVDQAKVDDAINRGVVYLKNSLDPSGTWNPKEEINNVGHAALPALALLECKVPPDDVAIQLAAKYVRQNVQNMDETYDLTCAVLFLDKLNDSQDRPLIRNLATRLLAGQNSDGTWGYKCPRVEARDGDQLLAFLEGRRLSDVDLLMAISIDPKDLPKSPPRREDPPKQNEPAKQPEPKLPPAGKLDLPAKLAALPVVKYQKDKGADEEQFTLTRGDNSNTLFALLGLWAARRHGIPVETSLDFAAKHFQKTQRGDGGWGYVAGEPTKNTMTCVGLLGLAMGHGATAEAFKAATERNGKPPRPPVDDPAIKDGLVSLARYLDGGDKEIRGLESRLDPYLFWAVERVGVLYQRDTFGKTDWYRWGAHELLKRQEGDGRWDMHYHAAVDTSFALLFLKRSNLVKKLTENLRSYLAIIDSKDQ